MAVDHYENFPVASVILPARLRPAVVHIYHFARSADDIADEGVLSVSERLNLLAQYHTALNQIKNNTTDKWETAKIAAVFAPLTNTIKQHNLPLQPFFDLLSAFEQDVHVNRYPTEAKLLDYCRRSANPVGNLMLHLFNQHSPDNIKKSDAICTALQLINFWQDIAIDWAKNRVYIPSDAMQSHGINYTFIQENTGRNSALPANKNWQALMSAQVNNARNMLLKGAPLGRNLGGRFGYEIRLIVQGGLRILNKLDSVQYDVFYNRPTLNKRDWPGMLWRAL